LPCDEEQQLDFVGSSQLGIWTAAVVHLVLPTVTTVEGFAVHQHTGNIAGPGCFNDISWVVQPYADLPL